MGSQTLFTPAIKILGDLIRSGLEFYNYKDQLLCWCFMAC